MKSVCINLAMLIFDMRVCAYFVASPYVMFSWYPWESCSFLKGNRGRVDLGEKRVKEPGGIKHLLVDVNDGCWQMIHDSKSEHPLIQCLRIQERSGSAIEL